MLHIGTKLVCIVTVYDMPIYISSFLDSLITNINGSPSPRKLKFSSKVNFIVYPISVKRNGFVNSTTISKMWPFIWYLVPKSSYLIPTYGLIKAV